MACELHQFDLTALLLTPRMKCLYISNTRHKTSQYRDGSARYRCYNIAEELLGQGYEAKVAALQDVSAQLLLQFDVVVFSRPELSRQFQRLLNLCAQKNIVAVADFDDLLFRPDLAAELPAVRDGRSSLAQAKKRCQNHLAALRLFERVSVATRRLAHHVTELAPQTRVFYLPNALSARWLTLNQHLDCRQARPGELLYLPGTRSHDHDFRTISSTLRQALQAESALALKLIGPLTIEPGMFRAGQLISGPDWVDFDQLPDFISRAMACLAPLSDTEFNRCKSHIKFIESAAFGTPLIASPIPDMTQHSVEGLEFPDSLPAWQHCLRRLQDREYFQHCSETLYHYARNNCTNREYIPGLLALYSTQHSAPLRKASSAPAVLDYSPAGISIAAGGRGMTRGLWTLKRKFRKLRYSPRHFIQDSALYRRLRKSMPTRAAPRHNDTA